MAWPSARYKTAANGGSWIPADMNGVQDQYIRSAGLQADDLETTAVQHTGLTTTAAAVGGAAVRRGKAIIATEETRTNVAYGLMTTPDRVQNVVLANDGLIFIAYHALWKESVNTAARAAIFIGANQLKMQGASGGAPIVQETGNAANAATYGTLHSYPFGVIGTGGAVADGSPVTTGQVLGSAAAVYPNVVPVFAAAGTYDISVQFNSSSGDSTVKERKLWVWTVGF